MIKTKEPESKNLKTKEPKRSRIIKILILVLISLFISILVALAGLWWWLTSTPQYAMSQWVSSFEDQDSDKFDKYFNYEEVITNTIKRETSDKEDTDPLSKALGDFLVPSLSSFLETEIEKRIDSGDFKENFSKQYEFYNSNLLLPGIFAQDWQKIDKDVYQVNFRNINNEEAKITWKKSSEIWEVVDIIGLEDLTKPGQDSELENSLDIFNQDNQNLDDTEIKANFDQAVNINNFEYQVLSATINSNVSDKLISKSIKEEELQNKKWLETEILIKNLYSQGRLISIYDDSIKITSLSGLLFEQPKSIFNSLDTFLLSQDQVATRLYFVIDNDLDSFSLRLSSRDSNFLSEEKTVIFDFIDFVGQYSSQQEVNINYENLNQNSIENLETMEVEIVETQFGSEPINKSYLPASDGNQNLSVKIKIKNIGKSVIYPAQKFFLKDSKARTYEANFSTDSFSDSLDPDQETTKTLVYEIPKDEKEVYLYALNKTAFPSSAKVFLIK